MTTTGTRQSGMRLVGSVAAGCLLGLPIGWLLATLAMLPFFLGLFFCMLLGLIIGAVMYRVAAHAAPASRLVLWLMGGVVSLVVWGTSLAWEYYNVRGYDVPWYGNKGFGWYAVDGDVTESVREWFFWRSFTPQQLAQLRLQTRLNFLRQLESQYPPGGFAGFLHWAVTGRSLPCPRVFSDSMENIELKQHGVVWIIRLALALILTAGAILSQVLGLAVSPQAKEDPGPDEHHEDAPSSAG